MEIHGFEAWRAIEKESRQQRIAQFRMDILDTSALVKIVANAEPNPIIRFAKTVWKERKFDDYGTREFLQEQPSEYIPTIREDYQARQILVERLG